MADPLSREASTSPRAAGRGVVTDEQLADIRCYHLTVPATNQSGRAFVLGEVVEDKEWLATFFANNFVDEDDVDRLETLRFVLRLAATEGGVATFDAYGTRHGSYCYFIDGNVSDEPIMMCLVVPTRYMAEICELHKRPAMETCSLQVINSEPTKEAVEDAVEAWAKRVFPGETMPSFRLDHSLDLTDEQEGLRCD